MCRFSIIVPLLGSVNDFEDTLASLLRHRPNDSQVIVVHDGTYRDPYHLASEVNFVNAQGDPHLIRFLNIGLCYAAGHWTVILHPGVELDEGWEDTIESCAYDQQVGCVTPAIISRPTCRYPVITGVTADPTLTRRLVSRGGAWNSQADSAIAGPSHWLAAYRTRLLKSLLPFDEQLDPVYWDLDTAMSLQGLGFVNRLDPEFIGYVENEQEMLNENSIPHGCSAQRAIRRFAESSWSRSIKNSLIELFQIPFQPWKLRHWTQRRDAGCMHQIDRVFHQRIQKLRMKLVREQPCSSEPGDISNPAAMKRAA